MLFFSSDDLLSVQRLNWDNSFLIHQGRPFFILPVVSPAAGRGIGQFEEDGKMPHIFSRILSAKCLAREI
jgi:hypothetical protein